MRNEFVELVAAMREAQKRYDKERNYGSLRLARELAARVDKALKKTRQPEPGLEQGRLV